MAVCPAARYHAVQCAASDWLLCGDPLGGAENFATLTDTDYVMNSTLHEGGSWVSTKEATWLPPVAGVLLGLVLVLRCLRAAESEPVGVVEACALGRGVRLDLRLLFVLLF